MSANASIINDDGFRMVFQESPSGIALLDTENHFLLANKKLLKMTGYDKEDLTCQKEMSFLDIVSPSDQPWVSTQLRKAEAGQEVSVLPCTMLRKDGSTVPALLRSAAMKQAGETTGVILFLQENKERSGIWVEESRPLGMGASGPLLDEVAHDFNDLLFLILGNIEYLKEKIGGDKDVKAHIDSALHAGEQVKELIVQLHNFSRQTQTTHRPVRVGSVIKETVELLNISLLPSIKIKMNIQSDALVMADPALMQQILMNLCANTEYAMHSKSGEIGIKLEEVLLDKKFTTGT